MLTRIMRQYKITNNDVKGENIAEVDEWCACASSPQRCFLDSLTFVRALVHFSIQFLDGETLNTASSSSGDDNPLFRLLQLILLGSLLPQATVKESPENHEHNFQIRSISINTTEHSYQFNFRGFLFMWKEASFLPLMKRKFCTKLRFNGDYQLRVKRIYLTLPSMRM